MTTQVGTIQPFAAPDPAAAGAVRSVIEDYYGAWFDADPERMARALHPQLAKRGWVAAPDGERFLDIDTAESMVEWTRQGVGRRDARHPERHLEIEVIEVYDDVATALVRTPRYVESLQLIQTDVGWQILGALWRKP
jgi:hypothetical protein